MAHSKQAHKGSHLLPECPKITCWYTAEDMQFKSVLPRATGMLINIGNGKGTKIGPWTG